MDIKSGNLTIREFQKKDLEVFHNTARTPLLQNIKAGNITATLTLLDCINKKPEKKNSICRG
jgi:hypothetical protein